jgi:hypothetical protein
LLPFTFGQATMSSDATASQGQETKPLDPDFDLIMDEHLAKNEWPTDKMNTIKSADRVSLMAQTMNEDLFNKLKDVKSAKVRVIIYYLCQNFLTSWIDEKVWTKIDSVHDIVCHLVPRFSVDACFDA